MRSRTLRNALVAYGLLLLPVAWLTMRYQPYMVDGDGVAYMDIADLLRTHHWAGAVNGYWNPLYPALLAVGQSIAHPSCWTELLTYRAINFVIFFAEVAAILFFVAALDRLRTRNHLAPNGQSAKSLLSRPALQLLGLGLLVIASQRELALAAIKPDALLQVFMMLAFALLLHCLATGSLVAAALMGVCFGLAYLAKSFAFLMTFISIAVLVFFLARTQPKRWPRALAAGLCALVCFGLVAGPFIAALSRQKGRFDFGDSGALNYAWYAGNTEKMHLEPWMKEDFGSATVHLIHPEQQLLAEPGIYSYRALRFGTYPDWFDPSFFHERIVPHLNPPVLLRRDLRNVALVFRYLLNHPEGLLLLLLLLATGARLRLRGSQAWPFWLPMVLLSLVMWGLYLIVNVEERYVTLAYLTLLLPVFAMLQTPAAADPVLAHTSWQRPAARGMVALLAFLALGESLRLALEDRRTLHANDWQAPQIFDAAHSLQSLGIRPGDEIACMGTLACLNDNYWMRLAGVRVLTEVYNPDPDHLLAEWSGLPNRPEVEQVLRAQGAKALVARFNPDALTSQHPALQGWSRLGETDFYALPLTEAIPANTAPATPSLPWPMHVRTTP